MLFACHPIHTEAVAGIVGRADVGSTAFALTAFLAYVNHVKWRDKTRCSKNKKTEEHRCPYIIRHGPQQHNHVLQLPSSGGILKSLSYLFLTIVFSTAAMLTKEQGITILLVCCVFDVIRSVIRAQQQRQVSLTQ